MPATLSVSPEAFAAGEAAALPLHAAHTVAPSPPELHTYCRTPLQSPPGLNCGRENGRNNVAAKYQKAEAEANNIKGLKLNWLRLASRQNHRSTGALTFLPV